MLNCERTFEIERSSWAKHFVYFAEALAAEGIPLWGFTAWEPSFWCYWLMLSLRMLNVTFRWKVGARFFSGLTALLHPPEVQNEPRACDNLDYCCADCVCWSSVICSIHVITIICQSPEVLWTYLESTLWRWYVIHTWSYMILLYIYIIMQTMCMGLDQFEIEMNLGLHQPRLAKPDMELLL